MEHKKQELHKGKGIRTFPFYFNRINLFSVDAVKGQATNRENIFVTQLTKEVKMKGCHGDHL